MKISCLWICCNSKFNAVSPEPFPTKSETTSCFTIRSYTGPIATKNHSAQETIELFRKHILHEGTTNLTPTELFSYTDKENINSLRYTEPAMQYRPKAPINTIEVLPRWCRIVPLNLNAVLPSSEGLPSSHIRQL